MIQLTAQRAVDLIRRHIEDENKNAFTDAQILDVMDEVLQRIFMDLHTSGDNLEVERYDFTLGAAEEVRPFEYHLKLPAYVAQVKSVEGFFGSRRAPQLWMAKPIQMRGFSGPVPTYHWSKARPGTLVIQGRVNGWGSLGIWFIRRWGNLHYGSCAAGAATNLLGIAASGVTGRVVERDGTYVGMDVEITSTLSAPELGMLHEIRRITAYSTRTFTVEPVWPTLVAATDTYSLVVPLQPEFNSYFTYSCAMVLLTELGAASQLASVSAQMVPHERQFIATLQERDSEAPVIFNNRM